MDCKQVEELIDAHVLGALDPVEMAAVETHLVDCGDCRVQFEQSRAVAALLPLGVRLVAAPEALFIRTMADIYRDLAENDESANNVRWLTPRWVTDRLVPAAAVAAAVVAVAALGLSMRLDGRVDDLDEGREAPRVADAGVIGDDQQLANLAFASDDLLRKSLSTPEASAADVDNAEEDGNVGAIYAWSPKWGVGVLLVTGLVAGRSYLACFESEEHGPQPGGIIQGQGSEFAQKAFRIVTNDRLVSVGLTERADCAEGGVPEEAWTHHWSLSD